MANNRRRQGGFTLIEGMVATFIMAVAIVAMFGSWSTCFNSSYQVSQTTEASEIARSVLETAKVFGAANLPTGTYSSSTATGTWTGAYIPSTGWTSRATAYYTFGGTQVASATAAGAFYSVTMTLTDSSVLAGTGTTYSIQASSIRAAVVTVTSISSGTVVWTMATNLVEGGI